MKSSSGKADYILLTYFGLLLVFGLIMLTSASSAVGHQHFGDGYFFIKRQLLLGVLPGLGLFFFLVRINYQRLRNYAGVIYVFIIILLLLVFVPSVGSDFGTGSHSWIVLWGYSFQPAEFAKLGLIIFMSAYLAKQGIGLKKFKESFLIAVGLGVMPIILVVLQPDIGTVIILFVILFAMLFIAAAKWNHLLLLATVGIVGLAIMIIIAPYRTARLTTFLHPELDPQGVGYHINQAFLAIGSGGLLGLGLGHSRQKFQYLPEVQADSIFAIIAEEMGFIFSVGLIILLILICYRGLRIAKYVNDQFARLLVSGIIVWFASQSFLNIGAMIGLVPLTGVPLPFVSHGGTALMMSIGGIGIIMNVSKYGKFG